MNHEERLTLLRILLVEDNEHDQIAFQRALRQSSIPFEVTICERSEDILGVLLSDDKNYDIVVIDYNLPGQNGLKTFCKLRHHDDLPPFVMLTGTDSHYLAADALKAGMHACIVKDPNQDYLRRLPLKLVDISRRYRECRTLRNTNHPASRQ